MKLSELRGLAAQKPILTNLNNASMLLNHIDLLLNVVEGAKEMRLDKDLDHEEVVNSEGGRRLYLALEELEK